MGAGGVGAYPPLILDEGRVVTVLVLSNSFSGTNKPVNWRNAVYELDPTDSENNGFINEDFIVWMRTAALPTFRKLYRIIQKKPNMATLSSGNYLLNITYSILRLVVRKSTSQSKLNLGLGW